MVMGSSRMENTNCIGKQCFGNARSKRPEFFPCAVCGRFFTTRAMQVHKRTCLENENCQCSACKSVSKKMNWESLQRKNKISLSFSSRHIRHKKKSKMKPRIRDLLTGKIHSVKNGVVGHDKLLTFKLVEENSYIIDKMVAENKSSQYLDSSAVKVTESAANNDHKCISFLSEITDVTESLLDKSCETLELNEKFNHDYHTSLPFENSQTGVTDIIESPLDKSYEKFHHELNLKYHQLLSETSENPFDNSCKTIKMKEKFDSDFNHKDISFPSNENSHTDVTESSSDKSCETVKLKEKLDHECNRKLFCCFCNEHFFWESFGLHVIQHCTKIQNNYLKCPSVDCDRFFSQPALFLTHYLIHNADHPLECNDCCCNNPTCCSSLNRVVDEHGYAESDPFHCYICLTRFSHPQTVINHMRLHSKEMPFKCSVCNRSFRQIGNLQRHMTTHRGDRPYKCTECSSSFADPATLRNHERVHTGETPYVCDVCTRGFTQVGNLKRHMALHLTKDPLSTTFSSTIEVSSDKNTILIVNPPKDIKINQNVPSESHGTNHNEEQSTSVKTTNNFGSMQKKTSHRKKGRKKGKMKVFTCTICNKVYAWKHDLAVHFRTHTGEKPYKCELCGKTFAQSGAVRIHKDRHHSGAAGQKNNLS